MWMYDLHATFNKFPHRRRAMKQSTCWDARIFTNSRQSPVVASTRPINDRSTALNLGDLNKFLWIVAAIKTSQPQPWFTIITWSFFFFNQISFLFLWFWPIAIISLLSSIQFRFRSPRNDIVVCAHDKKIHDLTLGMIEHECRRSSIKKKNSIKSRTFHLLQLQDSSLTFPNLTRNAAQRVKWHHKNSSSLPTRNEPRRPP